jgi:hypothetical protein
MSQLTLAQDLLRLSSFFQQDRGVQLPLPVGEGWGEGLISPVFAVFFRKRAGGCKLPLRAQAALVSIHTRFSGLFRDTPRLLKFRSIWGEKHLARGEPARIQVQLCTKLFW